MTNTDATANTETATFGAGCFWGVEDEFRVIPGVMSTAVGYMGGNVDNPSYEIVCTDATGHAEVVQLTYDPSKISYGELLDVFWGNHNPTTKDQQGPDMGSQYRSVIFFHTPAQEHEATVSKEKMDTSGKWSRPIVTQVVPAQTFWRAEEYHQKYHLKNGGSCHV
jgi:peptide-methionine (S)-S-oxide reductase